MTDHDQDDDGSSAPRLEGSIWFRSGSADWGSPRRMALLAAIDEHGSIAAAAKHIGLSYKAAWDAVDAMTNLAGETLVTRSTGGARGGGAALTARGRKLLDLYQALDREHRRFLRQLARAGAGPDPDLEVIRHMMIQTSARNKLAGTVIQVTPGAVNDEITVEIAPGIDVIATITKESAESMALQPGRRALAFIKASSILIGLPGEGLRLSARNQLLGRITRIVPGAVNAEVCVSLPTGQTLGAMVSKASVDDLRLEEGQEVYAVFKASSVMLGTLD